VSKDTSPIGTALDLLLYAPVGLALTVGEEVPKLAEKGRKRLAGQVAVARVVGKLAVGQGQRLVTAALDGSAKAPGVRRQESPSAPAPRPGQAGVTGPGSAGVTRTGGPANLTTAFAPSSDHPGGGAAGPVGSPGSPNGKTRRVGAGPAGGGVEAGSLAIPGYDSLSASQVVQRLAGLSSAELEAVRRYESAGRGRRTILSRISQLQAG